ncbi:MAG: single-stranded DNA-binding protein [Verrucomicrobia bacterium]|nr:single-stranded DNA-binding protein [Verrucomicrobiota bacterium]MBS0646359.1 single-stranded DNA-binding protein [Verrucomicrobiota bacterium]
MIIVEIAGFLGDDAEERFTATGKRVVSLRVATKARQGGAEATVWWRVNIWGDRFDKMLPYLKKGSPVIVIGEMNKPETYTAKDGTTQVSMTMTAEMIRFSPFGRPDRDNTAAPSESSGQDAFSTSYGTAEPVGAVSDDLPF